MLSWFFQKAEHKAAEKTQGDNAEEASGEDYSQGKYGPCKMIQSAEKLSERNFIAVNKLSTSINEKSTIWVRGRIHTSRCKGKQCFLVIRQQSSTVQVLLSVNENISKQMVKFSGS